MIAAIVSNAVFVATLIPVALIVTPWLRRPAIAHAVWVLLLVRLLTPPIVGFPIVLDLTETGIRIPSLDSAPGSIVVVIWMTGSLVAAGLAIHRTEALRRWVSRRGDIHPPANDLAESVDSQRKVWRTPQVWLVQGVHSPMLVGLGPWAAILFPRDLWFQLTIDQRRSLLAHEIAHFRRGDWAWRLAELIATVLYWWFIPLWIIRRQIERYEEQCCDAAAARLGQRVYASAVLSTMEFLQEPESYRPSIASCLGKSADHLEQRIRSVLAPGSRQPATRTAWTLWAIFAAALLIGSPQIVLVSQQSESESQRHATSLQTMEDQTIDGEPTGADARMRLRIRLQSSN
jgi:beta-lactamase regulating signal transducer with metallopeptidase domain